MSQETSERAPAATVAEVLQRIEASWRDFLAVLDDVPEERLEEPDAVGEWSVKNLFGHIAFWDDHSRDHLAATLAGQQQSYDDWQELNEADHLARLGRTLPEERTAMHQAHAALLDRLDDLPGLRGQVIDEAIKGGTYEHYDEHAVDLRDWLARTA